MEFYNDDNPATRFFNDDSLVLSGGRVQDETTREWTFTERILYTSYQFDDKSISISIFDDTTRSYLMEPVYVKDYETAERILQSVKADYPTKVHLDDYLPAWKTFYDAMENGTALQSRVTDSFDECGQCGDYNRDEFIFLYVPAVAGTALDEASLGLHWDFGCFGGKKITGVYEDVVDEIVVTLNDMKAQAQKEFKPAIQEALDVLTAVTN